MSVIDLTHLDDVALPTTDAEIWRYSRIGELDLTAYTPDRPRGRPRRRDDLVVRTDTVELFDETPDVFAGLNRSAGRTVHLVVPAGRVVAEPVVVTHSIPGGGALTTPRLVDRGRRRQRGHRHRAVRLRVRRARAHAARPAAPCRSRSAGSLPRRQRSPDGLVDRPPAVRERPGFDGAPVDGGPRRRLRPGPHRGPLDREGRVDPPGGALLRGRRADARLPRHPGPRRPAHHSDLLFKGAVQDHARRASTPGSSRSARKPAAPSAFQTNRNLTLRTARGPRACPTSTSGPTT
jgi:Fe-S cluster assembly protein SufD